MRGCPLCFVKLSSVLVLSRSNDMSCPTCHAELELSRHSRVLASLVGIVAATVVFHLSSPAIPLGHSVIPVLLACVAFGVGSALLLLVRADLVVRHDPHSGTFPHTQR